MRRRCRSSSSRPSPGVQASVSMSWNGGGRPPSTSVLVRHSSNSASARASQTMPLPVPYSARSAPAVHDERPDRHVHPAAPARARGRRRTRCRCPRGVRSISLMICIVRTLGAPVIDADGKSASRISSSGARGLGADGRGHLPERRVALGLPEPRHPDRPDPGDPAQVVAHHVHDHHVLGPLLLGGAQAGRLQPVLDQRQPARRGPLHRAAGQQVVLEAEAEFGGRREDGEPAGVDKRRVPRPLGSRESGEARERVARPRERAAGRCS